MSTQQKCKIRRVAKKALGPSKLATQTGAPVTDLIVKCHLKLHIDITLHCPPAACRLLVSALEIPERNLSTWNCTALVRPGASILGGWENELPHF